jgi:UDP-glucose 4-epimerase
MNILVTGGAGFIGSHITDLLVLEGHRVAVLDNLSKPGYTLHPEASHYILDITDDRIENVFKVFKPEVVIHHAAQINVQTSIKRPQYDAEVNILGSIALLENCRKYGVRKVIYASSAAVYGKTGVEAVCENHPTKPLSFYGVSKYTVEHYIDLYSRLYDLDYSILRYSNVYGDRQTSAGEGGVISIFLEDLMKGQCPTIFGSGEQSRDFIYVKDVAAANIACLRVGSKGVYNISTHQSISINGLFQKLTELLKLPLRAEYRNGRPEDILHSCLNNNRACKELDWAPVYSLDQGLCRTWEYYKKS